MSNRLTDIIRVRLSLQKAMLGNIVPNLRGITFGLLSSNVKIIAYFNGPIASEDAESMSCIETELISDFYPEFEMELILRRCDSPREMEMLDMWVYFRKE